MLYSSPEVNSNFRSTSDSLLKKLMTSTPCFLQRDQADRQTRLQHISIKSTKTMRAVPFGQPSVYISSESRNFLPAPIERTLFLQIFHAAKKLEGKRARISKEAGSECSKK
jgi:hypothetical protein